MVFALFSHRLPRMYGRLSFHPAALHADRLPGLRERPFFSSEAGSRHFQQVSYSG